MIHDHALMIHYVKYGQQFHIQICKFTELQTAQPLTCFGHLLWPSSRRCSLKDTSHRQQNQQTQHHHFHLDGVTIYTANQHETGHKQCYQYFIF